MTAAVLCAILISSAALPVFAAGGDETTGATAPDPGPITTALLMPPGPQQPDSTPDSTVVDPTVLISSTAALPVFAAGGDAAAGAPTSEPIAITLPTGMEPVNPQQPAGLSTDLPVFAAEGMYTTGSPPSRPSSRTNICLVNFPAQAAAQCAPGQTIVVLSPQPPTPTPPAPTPPFITTFIGGIIGPLLIPVPVYEISPAT